MKIVGTDVTAFIRRAELARDRADQRPERFGSGRRSTPASPQSTARPARSRSPSRRAKSPRRRKPSRNTAPPTPAPRWATSWARRSSSATTNRKTRKPRKKRPANNRTCSPDPSAAFRGAGASRLCSISAASIRTKERTMSLDADSIVDRRRMRRKLTFWRVAAVVVAVCARSALRRCAAGQPAGSRHGDYIARISDPGPDPRQPGPRRGARPPVAVERARP